MLYALKFIFYKKSHFEKKIILCTLILLKDLFKKVIPHQCLGAVWSRRDKYRSTEAGTVLATVNQFNAVSFRVISTILMDSDIKFVERAKIISTWIDVAQVRNYTEEKRKLMADFYFVEILEF